MNNIFKCTDMQARCHGKICALHAQCAEYLGNHADTNTYLSRHLIASLLRLIHIFTSLCLFLKKISFFQGLNLSQLTVKARFILNLVPFCSSRW